jgi:hypothetical protein
MFAVLHSMPNACNFSENIYIIYRSLLLHCIEFKQGYLFEIIYKNVTLLQIKHLSFPRAGLFTPFDLFVCI